MSDSDFSVNADAMGPAVEGLKSLGDRLGQITQHLESTLDGLGKPWGDDKNGHNFFQQYGKSRDQVLTGMASMTDATHGVATGINTMIKGYNNINDNAKERARNLGTYDGSGDYSGGGSYGDGSGSGERQLYRTADATPVMRAERRLAPMEARRRVDALAPTEGVPATDENGEPLQRGTLREGTLRRLDDVPAEPLQPMEALRPAERGIPASYMPAEPAYTGEEPLLPMEGTRQGVPMGRLLPEEPAIPAERVRMTAMHDVMPLEPTRAYDRIPAEPTQPAHLYDRIPAEPLQPTHEYTREAVPLQPTQTFERVREGTPVEPVQPTHVYARTEEALPLQPTIAAEPARFEAVRESVPAEPVHYESVHEDAPVEQPREFVRSEAPLEPRLYEREQAIPEEPQGFAELEPERYTPLLPETPAEPAQ